MAGSTVVIRLTGTLYEDQIEMSVEGNNRKEIIRSLPYTFEIAKELLPIKLKFKSGKYIYYDITVPYKPFDSAGHVYLLKVDESQTELESNSLERNASQGEKEGHDKGPVVENNSGQFGIEDNTGEQMPSNTMPGTSDVDVNIPSAKASRENTFCVIIANERYKEKDTPDVKYAEQDGKTFRDYCIQTLGLPQENVKFAANASFLQMRELLKWVRQISDVFGDEATIMVYYAGHGVPDEKGNCSLIPSDASINSDNGFSLKELYATLGGLSVKNALVLIDACFSGNDRSDVSALDNLHRGLVREVKQETAFGNVVAFTAASDSETALAYEEKGHGMFSYYLMKKLQETSGDVTYGELFDYIRREVLKKSVVSKGKKQTPSVVLSDSMVKNWKSVKL